MKLVFDNIMIEPGPGTDQVLEHVRRAWKIAGETRITVLRRSLDARKKGRIHYLYRVAVELADDEARRVMDEFGAREYSEPSVQGPARCRSALRVVVVGAGPAGLFCALRLARAGAAVTLVERGRPVEERHRDVKRINRDGELDPESNVLFGEGGAGTYSDGKLTARTHRPESAWFFHTLVEHGAPEEVLYEAHPHLGSDRLVSIVSLVRRSLLAAGVTILFGERVDDLVPDGGRVAGAVTSSGREIRADAVVLACGHSARDTYALLERRGAALEPKAFAAGVRAEHPAELIASIQYGRTARLEFLPAAEYRMTFTDTVSGRGIYTFCMCPGGEIINASSEPGMLAVNGMSLSARDMPRSNAALVVTVTPNDFPGGPLAGIDFQRGIERAAFLAGGGGFRAPAQSIASFMAGAGPEPSLRESSYRPGVTPNRIESYLPHWLAGALRAGIAAFDRKMRGFAGPEGMLVGAETRTSSPVRVLRGGDFQSISMRGLYPAGEGAGYAGGIVSSAVDGIRVADAIVQHEKA